MIIAGHYKGTGAHIFSSMSSSGQSLMVLTGRNAGYVSSVDVWGRGKRAALWQDSTASSRSSYLTLYSAWARAVEEHWAYERKDRRKAEISNSCPAAACSIQSQQGGRSGVGQWKWNCTVPGFRLPGPSGCTVIMGRGFVKQQEMQMLLIERQEGDLCSAGNMS